MTDREALLAEVGRRLGRRELVWAGIRGSDIEPLRDLPQLTASYSIIDAYAARSDVVGVAYEDLTGVRVDPEVWDIDEHHHDDATVEFRHGLLRALSANSALLPYRASSFLSAVHFARRDRCLRLGLVGAHQSAFEHKPFVESAVADLGLPHIPWTYIADEEQVDVIDLAKLGPLILRRSRTSGGEGFVRVDNSEEVRSYWPKVDEAFVSVAPYITDAIPVNVGATVWRNAPAEDCVSVHHPSVQLIGIESCVTREFGYCGNDFGRARELPHATIDQIEESTKAIGRWLRSHGYVGSFGVDFLVKDDVPLFTEVNPRFQGSTVASSRLSIEEGEACLVLEHVASWLGIAKPQATRPLVERLGATRDLANLVIHWAGDQQDRVDADSLVAKVAHAEGGAVDSDVVVSRGIMNDPGSLVARFALNRQVTTTGYELTGDLDTAIRQWQDDRGTA